MKYPEAAISDIFSQGARPLTRVGPEFTGTPRKVLIILFSRVPTPFTSFNSFASYSTLYPTSRVENTKKRPDDTFIGSARPLARIGFGGADVVLGAFPLLFPTLSTLFTSFNSFPS